MLCTHLYAYEIIHKTIIQNRNKESKRKNLFYKQHRKNKEKIALNEWLLCVFCGKKEKKNYNDITTSK